MIKSTTSTKTNFILSIHLVHQLINVTQKTNQYFRKSYIKSIIKCYLIDTWKLTILREVRTNKQYKNHTQTTEIIYTQK